MKYLLYIRNGQIKKFPLKKKINYLGRDKECDFFIDEDFISRIHARVTCLESEIKVEDLDSKNGIYIRDLKVKESLIRFEESFRIGYLEFIFKKGNPEEFILSEATRHLVKRVSNLITVSHEETKTTLNLFDKALVTTLQLGFCITDFEEILDYSKTSLANTIKTGQLLILKKENKKSRILSILNLDENKAFVVPPSDLGQAIFESEILNQNINRGFSLYSFPIKLTDKSGTLLYIRKDGRRLDKKMIDFLRDFSSEISLIYRLLEKNKFPVKFVSKNETLLNLLTKCKKIAPNDIRILIEGETGTGKELFARFIHWNSGRGGEKYVAINCSAIPESLLEDELFGHEKGAFTGANEFRKGKLELASGGTLVFDEIGEMPLKLQAKLLRVLEEDEFNRLGGNKSIKVDLKIISLTNRNLYEMVKANQFREDLYYRISEHKIEVPPLRKRKDDIIPLIKYFFEKFSKRSEIAVSNFSQRVIDALQYYDWPGNVRELENEIKSLVYQSNTGDIIDFDLLNNVIKSYITDLSSGLLEEPSKEKLEILNLLEKNRWNKSNVAKKLNISRTALYNKMRKYNIDYYNIR